MQRTLIKAIFFVLLALIACFAVNGTILAKKEQSIFFNLPSTFLCSSAALNLVDYASSTSGLKVDFTIISGAGTISELGVFVPQKPGLFVIAASQAGNDEYDSAFTVIRSIVVNSQFYTPELLNSINIKSPLCLGDSATFTVNQVDGLTYLWKIADLNVFGNTVFIPSINSTITTTSTLTIYESVCEVSSYQFKPLLFFTEPISSDFIPNSATSGDTIQLEPSIKTGYFKNTDIINFEWIVPFRDKELISYVYSDSNNCKIEISKEVNISKNNGSNVLIYEYVTPNGDGFNDVVFIKDINRFLENELLIFNRWGNSVFQQKNYRNDWSPKELPKDLYYYVLRLDNGRLVYSGNIYVSN